MLRILPLFLLLGAIGCDPATIVTTNVTLPTAPSSVVTVPAATTTNPTCPTCPTTCTPTATTTCGGGGQQQRAPDIVSFGADSARVSKGGLAVLRWEVPDFGATVRIDPGIGSVATTGFVLVFPTVTTTYTLTARNNFGIAQRQFTVVVLTAE